MKFSDFMMSIHEHDVDLSTYMAPNNFTTAKEEFLTNPELVMPNFTYDYYDFKESLTRLDEIEQQLFTASSSLHATQVQIIVEYLASVKTKLTGLMAMQQYREQRSLGVTQESIAALRKTITDMNLALPGRRDLL